MDSETNELMKQFGGSAMANMAFGLMFLLYAGIKKICDRPSKCKSHIHCCCIDLDVQDKTIRSEIELTNDEENPIT
jgi:hypothetical protein